MTPLHHPKSLRADTFLYFMRLVQLLFTLIILGITGDNASVWHTFSCSTPAKLAFNIAVAALTLPTILYLLLSTGPKSFTNLLPWHSYAQLTLDTLFTTLWIAATAASKYDCAGLCSACISLGEGGAYNYYAAAGSLCCLCWEGSLLDYCTLSIDDSSNNERTLHSRQRTARLALENRAGSSSAAATRATMKASRIGAKYGIDAALIVLFLITLAATSWRLYNERKAANAARVNQSASYGVGLNSGSADQGVKSAGTVTESNL